MVSFMAFLEKEKIQKNSIIYIISEKNVII